jgi:hypothetical protein
LAIHKAALSGQKRVTAVACVADVLDWYQCHLPHSDQPQQELTDVEAAGEALTAGSKQQQLLAKKHGRPIKRKTVCAWLPIWWCTRPLQYKHSGFA